MKAQVDKIAVLDFGGQYAHLIANRIRRLKVFSEILPSNTPAENLKTYKGLILSGGPQSVYDKNAPKCDKKIFKLGIPILGICYGHQISAYCRGGRVEQGNTKEYGLAVLRVTNPKGIFKGLGESEEIWMSHGDEVKTLPEGSEQIGFTADCEHAAIADFKKHIYGIQFHAEVTHTLCGQKILNNFIDICRCRRTWSIANFMKQKLADIKKQARGKKVFLLISGGVDSTVTFALLERALGQERVYGLFVDTGFMRKGERREVEDSLEKIGFKNLHVYVAQNEFFDRLKDVYDPEKKRKIIGEHFLEIQRGVVKSLCLNPEEWLLGQGTIYPDTIESGGTRHADKIKTHHNRVPEIEELIRQGKVIEPVSELYKDEVREIGENLGLQEAFIWRHPFPGPGLAVRCLCARKKSLPKDSQQIEGRIQNFLRDRFGMDKNQLVAKIIPIQSVGVQGDARTYRHPVALMGEFPDWKMLGAISTGITNKFKDINRVLYYVSSSYRPAHKQFTLTYTAMTKSRIKLLQKADAIVMKFIYDHKINREIWQFPTVLIPLSVGTGISPPVGLESVVLRPVASQEAMTANFYQMNPKLLKKLVRKLDGLNGLSGIFYDLTNKPPGTIEWE